MAKSPEGKFNPFLRESVVRLRQERKSAEILGETQEKDWDVYDSPLSDFALYFSGILPEGESRLFRVQKNDAVAKDKLKLRFLSYLECALRHENGTPLTAVEFGGPGSRLFGDFPEGFFAKTVGVCLKDIRNEKQKEKDAEIHHSLLEGDIFRNYTYTNIRKVLGTDKVDLIISRMVGPLERIEFDSAVWAKVGRAWYHILNEGGVMFIQFRKNIISGDPRSSLVQKWGEFVKERYGDVLEIQVDEWSFRLVKKNGAPEELPLLQDFTRI